MEAKSNTNALAVAMEHSPFLLRRVGLTCHDLHHTLVQVAPAGKAIAAGIYEKKMEKGADNRQWKKVKIMAGDGDSITNDVPPFKAWAYYAPSGPQDFIDEGDYRSIADLRAFWISQKTAKRYIRHLARAMNCEQPGLYDFEFVKQRRRGLSSDRTLCKVFLKDYDVNWYEGWEMFD